MPLKDIYGGLDHRWQRVAEFASLKKKKKRERERKVVVGLPSLY
jgi:hypothetical protein